MDEAISTLERNEKSVTSINLCGKNIGDTGAQSLARVLEKNTTLTSIDLNSNNIGDTGAQSLARALEKNTTLTSINLNVNNIGDTGGQSLARALEKNTTLTSIYFGSNNIGDTGAQSLARALEKNTTLTSIYFGSNNIGDTGAQSLARALEKNTTLTSIYFGSNNIGEAGARFFASVLEKNTTLVSIDLRYNNIGDTGVQSLARALEKNTTLASINLNSNKIGETGGQILASILEKNTTLTSINLSFNNIGDTGAQSLARALEKNTTLTSIDLGHNNIGDAGAQSLAKVLEKNTTLTSIDLRYNNIGDAGSQSLARVLEKNTTLTSIYLGYNNIGDTGAQSLARALEKNTTLASINLSSNKIGDTGVQSIARALEKNTTLASITLDLINIGDTGVQSLARALEKNTTLTSIDLDLSNGAQNMSKKIYDIRTRNRYLLQEKYKSNKSLGNFRALDDYTASDNSEINIKQGEVLQILNKSNPWWWGGKKSNGETGLLPSYLLEAVEQEKPPIPVVKREKVVSTPVKTASDAPFAGTGLIILSAEETSQLPKIKELGRGAYGVVYLSDWRGMEVALKELNVTQFTEKEIREFRQESEIMAKARAKYVVSLYAISLKPYCMIMEYMPRGSLYDCLKSSQPISWELRTRMALEIAKGLVFLHHSRILHRDLKSINILLDEDYHAKIADFGLSRMKSANSILSTTNQSRGTLAWMAPELHVEENAVYTDKCDIYSYAMVVWELASRQLPFANARNAWQIPQWVLDGKRPDIPAETPPILANIIRQCWEGEPEKRPTAQQVVDLLEGNGGNNNNSAYMLHSNPKEIRYASGYVYDSYS